MQFDLNAYSFIIFLSGVVILANIYNLIAKRLRIPSVLLLIASGIFLGEINRRYNILDTTLIDPVLEILGITGLMIIVLEAALDLELKKEKIGLIFRSFSVALIVLVLTSMAVAFLIKEYWEISIELALVYAIPLCIVSSAITIPSVVHLDENKKEFMIYESTFSDILGIILFYFMLEVVEVGEWQTVIIETSINNLLTIIASITLSYLLILMVQRIGRGINYYLILALLMLIFAVGKLLHLSSLIMILIFGLILNNHRLFFIGFLNRFIKHGTYQAILLNLKGFTAQTSFLVRTFFFLVFGMTISLAVFKRLDFYLLTFFILLILYGIRAVSLALISKTQVFPELWIAPRGLITILLFFSMPSQLAVAGFEKDLVLMLILSTNIIMMLALLFTKRKEKEFDEINQAI